MRKLLLLTLVLGFSSSVFAKENNYCFVSLKGDHTECVFEGERVDLKNESPGAWFEHEKAKTGIALRIHSKYSANHTLVTRFCDFSKAIVIDGDTIFCSKV